MFIGREDELKDLNDLYESNSFEFVVMYGRRRVGKTTLISEFCKDKPAIFYVAQEHNDKMSLESFGDKILDYFGMKEFMPRFQEWEMAFKYVGKMAEEKRIILVIDEFPYIATANKSLCSILQNVIDHYLKNTKIFLIVCGSSMSFIEKEVLSYKSPLFGRRTAQFKIEPFDFFTSTNFVPNYSLEDKVATYGVLGGIPQYLERFQNERALDENIKHSFLNKNSYFYDEPKNLLKQELREPAFYNSIIEAIANGYTKLNEISTKVGESTDKCSKYIKNLIDLGIVIKETPIGEKENNRKTLYKLKDNMFSFWYRFVFNNIELIEQRKIDYIYENKIVPYMSEYLGFIFEEICIQYLKRLNKDDKLPFVFESIGKWWGTNKNTKTAEEIDVIATSKDSIIIGECKWKNELLGMDVVKTTIERGSIFNHKNKYYMFFSKSGFTKEVVTSAEKDDSIILVSVSDFERLIR